MGKKKAFFRNRQLRLKQKSFAIKFITSFGETTRFGQEGPPNRSVSREVCDGRGRLNGGTDGNGLACAYTLMQ